MKKIIVVAVILLAGILVYGIFKFAPFILLSGCDKKEVDRITSPDKLYDIVIIEYWGSAGESVRSRLFIVPKGSKIRDYNDYNLIFSHAKNLNVCWADNGLINICYSKAYILFFSNSKHYLNNDNLKSIELKLVQTSDGHALYDFDVDTTKNK
jgi:hypothetical protein